MQTLGKGFRFFYWREISVEKIHELIFNIPRFVKNKLKTIGMLSEQDGESKHAAVKAERSLACVCNHAERI